MDSYGVTGWGRAVSKSSAEPEDITEPDRRLVSVREQIAVPLRGLTGGVLAGAVLRVLSAALAITINIVLARKLGVTEFGAFSYTLSCVWLITALCAAGLDRLLVRYVAAYASQSSWQLLDGLFHWVTRCAVIVAIGVAGVLMVVSALLPPSAHSLLRSTLPIAAVAVPLLILLRLKQASLRGFNKIGLSQLPELVILPVMLIAGTFFFDWLRPGGLNRWAVSYSYLGACSIAVVLASAFLQSISYPRSSRTMALYDTRAWIASSIPLMAVGALEVINDQAETLFLGHYNDARSVGVYVVAKRGAGLIAFALAVVNVGLAPTFASLYASGQVRRLQTVITQSARWALLASTVIAAVMIFGRGWFLGLFGSDYSSGQIALTILALSQWVSAAFGSVACLLVMTGHEKDVALGMGVSTIANLALSALLIPSAGLVGAAITVAISMSLWNITLLYFVRRRLNLTTVAWGRT